MSHDPLLILFKFQMFPDLTLGNPIIAGSYVLSTYPHCFGTLPYFMFQKEVPGSSGTFPIPALAFLHGTLVPFIEEMSRDQGHYVATVVKLHPVILRGES